MIRVLAMEAVGSVLLFAVAYYWLGLPSASAGHLAISAILALAGAMLAAYLIALAFNRQLGAAGSRTPVMLLWLLIAAVVFAALMPVWGWSGAAGNWLGSALTLGLRTPVKPQAVSTVYDAAITLLAALILMTTLLPAAARAAHTGSLRDWHPVFSKAYLAASALYLFAGLWLPWTLFWYIPTIASFEGQMASFLLRGALAFGLFVGAWVVFAWYCRAQALAPEVEHAG